MIIDGYVDEPSCLGVPPYISPYPRYIAGAIVEGGLAPDHIHYLTIDQVRSGRGRTLFEKAGLIVIIAGTTVPGNYLRGRPIDLHEIRDIGHMAGEVPAILGGPVRLGFAGQGGMDAAGIDVPGLILAEEDIEAFIFDYMASGTCDGHRKRSTQEIARWGRSGAFIIAQHPDYPHVMCELETYRGCARPVHCSFCTEPFYGEPEFRCVEDVAAEAGSLYTHGARYFRIGRQPDLFSYMARDTGGELPRPDPEVLERLYRGIRSAAPQLAVLHMDNANPGTIAAYPEESEQIARTIVKYHTPGDVAAMGMESADPAVVRVNCLKAMPEDVMDAVRLINRVGAGRGSNGLPELLPGLNFIQGLRGETKRTFDMNLQFLRDLLDEGLMVRRINIRQLMAFPDTPIWGQEHGHHELFRRFKDRVRSEIDMPMLKRVVPSSTVLRDVMCEVHEKSITFGRQLASYPILVGIPARLPASRFIDVMITGHGHRSVTGVPYPLDINSADPGLIGQLPGVGKKRLKSIIAGRPYRDEKELLSRLGNADSILPYIKFD